jgi:hypothetical protein
MTRLRTLSLTAALAVLLVAVAGCTDEGIGRKCINPNETGAVTGTQIVSPALECHSRLCFLNESPLRSVCTTSCETDDDCAGGVIDPAGADKGYCGSKFVCAIATVAGPFCCKRLCVCKEDLQKGVNLDDNGQVTVPPSCRAGSGSSCANKM